MTRALFIVNSLRFGGAEKHVVSLLNHLDADAFQLYLAYLKPDDHLLPEIRTERLKGVLCCRVGGKVDRRAVRQLAGLIDDAGMDVVVCTNQYALLYGVLAGVRAARHPRIVEVFHSTLFQGWKLRLQMVFYWPFFRACDMLVYVCGNQRRYWRRRGLRAAADTFIYNGIDTEHFADAYSAAEKQQLRQGQGFRDGDYVVGICAALRREKAHDDLLQAIAGLRAEGIPAKCLIVGDGPERPAIERRIAALGLPSHVVITGFQADVRPFIAACDVMALVSHAETFSISALEAMALGRPMVMSRVGGADEQIQDGVNGFMYEPGDVEALGRCLASLADPVRRTEMGRQAREVVLSRFAIDTMVRRHEALLKTLAGDAVSP
ncbi:MAG: glycosyltransferase [Candidatus Krumholzibacteriia bacterium]